jgi:hypothetical protein
MTTHTYDAGRAIDKTNNLCDVTGLDIEVLRQAGTIADGDTVVMNYLGNRTYTGRDVCQGFKNINVIMNFPYGDVIFDCTPIAPNTSSTLFPYSHTFNGSWGQKGCIIFGGGDLTINTSVGSLTIKNATQGTGYGNIAGIRHISFVSGQDASGSLTLNGTASKAIEIYGCDDGILASGDPASGESIVLRDCNIHDCGSGDGQSHNVYIGRYDLLAVLDSTSINCKVGHSVKTRARVNVLIGNNFRDTSSPAKAGSYVIDQSGGILVAEDNDIGQEANDSNQSVMTSCLTNRDGDGPHESFYLGNRFYSNENYRGLYYRLKNPYLDPAQDYHTAPQLGWAPITVCLDGNDFQYVDLRLDYGDRAVDEGIPVNSGVTKITGTNRLIATSSPSASTPYANVSSPMLLQSAIGDLLDGLTTDDIDDTAIAALVARSISLQGGASPPAQTLPDDTPPDPEVPPDDPVVETPDYPTVQKPRTLNEELQTLWVIAIAQQLKTKRQPVLTFSSAHTLTEEEGGCLFRESTLTLPDASPGLWYDLNGGSAARAGSDTIYDGASTGTTLTAASSDCHLRLKSPKAGLWFVASKTGTWTLS